MSSLVVGATWYLLPPGTEFITLVESVAQKGSDFGGSLEFISHPESLERENERWGQQQPKPNPDRGKALTTTAETYLLGMVSVVR